MTKPGIAKGFLLAILLGAACPAGTATYFGDVGFIEPGLAARSDILFFSGYETNPWSSVWGLDWGPSPAANHSIITGAEAFSGNTARVFYPADTYGTSANGTQYFQDWANFPIAPRESAYCRYYVKFQPGFQFNKGGKLPGFCGAACNTGCSGIPTGSDGWSARIMWRGNGQIVQYVYHMDQADVCGTDFPWTLGGCPVYFRPGEWTCVETYVQMNTPGVANGILRSWLNGQLALEVTNMRWRASSAIQVDHFYFSTFFGGSDATWNSPQDQYAYFDNFVIAQNYVGPVPGPAGTPTPTATAAPPPSYTMVTRIFDSDNAGWSTSNWSSGTYNFNDPAQNHTTGGAESLRIQYADGGWGAAQFTSPVTLTPAGFENLYLWVMPLGCDAVFRVRVRLGSTDVAETVINGGYVGGWRVGQWNLVLVPKSLLNLTSQSFDRILLVSNSTVACSAFHVDDFVLGNPSAAPTNTPTRSPTPTTFIPSNTFTRTPTASATTTRTPTGTPTATATNSITSTVTRSPTPTWSNSATATVTRSPTPSVTFTPTFSVTRTATSTVTLTSTATRSPTPTWTNSATATPSPSATLSPTRTSTATASRTSSPTATGTSTWTNTATSTVTRSATASSTRTVTPTVSPTWSSTPTFSVTATLTWTRTPSPSPTGSACAKRMLAYYPYWDSTYRASAIPMTRFSHICHAFVQPQADGSLAAPVGPPAYLEPQLITLAHAAGVKVLVSVGGADPVADANFRTLAASSSLRAAFATSLEAFCRTNGYDGVDLDWEFPGDATDRTNLNLMVQAIRDRFNAAAAPAPTWLITMAVSGSNWWAQWLDYATLNASVDFYNLMTYDMTGSWLDHAAHNAPMAQGANPYADLDVAEAVDYTLMTRGVPAAKVNLGIPFYGYRFPSSEDLYDPCGGSCSTAVQMNYDAIAPLIGSGWTRTWDAQCQVPYLRNDAGAGFITYDDSQSVTVKVGYSLTTRGLGGVFMWDITADTVGASQPLLDAMYGAYQAACGTVGTPTPTATATPSRTSTVTWTRTATATLTSSATRTNTVTTTATRSPTPTSTTTATATSSPTRTSTATASRTSSPTATGTPTITPTWTVSHTSTGGPSFTWTGTSTPTTTATRTVTRTFTPTVTPTPTGTSTFTATDTRTPTDTATSTASRTATRTETSSPTRSSTPTETGTPTYTPTVTYTVTRTYTPTWTIPPGTDTPTGAPTDTPTPTSSTTATPSSSPSFTATPTASPSGTATFTLTATRTWTPTISDTPTWTVTPTRTPALTDTPTSTVTATLTRTVTRSPTSTSTPSHTFSMTPTGTRSPTPTPTATPTRTPTPTVTYSVTPTRTSTITGTPTATWTLTRTSTHTPPWTPTPTYTGTAPYTSTPTYTPTPTETPVDTVTPTLTSTPRPPVVVPDPTEVVPYPNPCMGDCDDMTVRLNLDSPGPVRVQVFTTAFRRVSEQVFPDISAGVTTLKVTLRDGRGARFANGLYHLRVTTGSRVALGKLLILH